jgi:hypothetical protein
VGSQSDIDGFGACSHNDAQADTEDSDQIDKLMDQAGDEWSANPDPVQTRSMKIIIVKSAARMGYVPPVVPVADIPDAALLYGLYKVAAVRDIQRLSKAASERLLFACAVDQNIGPT